MAPSLSLLPRASNYGAASSSGLPTIVIVGFVVAGVIVLLVAGWLGLRWYRKRAARKRDNARGAAFLSVRGLVKDDGSSPSDPEKAGSAPSAFGGPQFSRAQLTQSVVMPSRAYRADASDAEIVQYHASTDTLPKPFSFALSASSSPPPSPGAHTPAAPSHGSAPSISIVPETDRRSWRSSVFNAGRGSFLSVSGRASSARDSVASSLELGGHAGGASRRKVRQLFNPVLPDELVLALGEALTVVHSYDDGWCIVGRESSIFAAAAAASAGSDAFGQHAQPVDKAELGAVPAWVFVKPVKGLRAERPMRSTSLGVTVELSAPSAPFSSREECVSWSNF